MHLLKPEKLHLNTTRYIFIYHLYITLLIYILRLRICYVSTYFTIFLNIYQLYYFIETYFYFNVPCKNFIVLSSRFWHHNLR